MATLKVTAVPDFSQLKSEITALQRTSVKIKVDAQPAQLSIQNVRREVGQLGTTAEKTGSSISSMFTKIAAVSPIYAMVRAFQSALSTMKAVNDELIAIQKVTGYTAQQMDALTESAYKLATQYGRSADEVLSAATVFARAGYGEQAESLAELSLLTQNVGDVSADAASKFLIAADAAWKLGGNEDALMRILDGLNEVTNRNAVDMDALTEAITVGGSVFAEAGESTQTFTALVGAAVSATQRSGGEVARALRTILMNIRQIRGELEDGELVDGQSIANASNALRTYAGISTTTNGQLRRTSAVLEDLAEKWDTLDTVAQSAISEALAGKRQANVLMALMGNWRTVGKAIQDYADGAGSALAENEFYLQGWTAKSKQLDAAWTEFVSHLIDTGVITGALDTVTAAVDMLDSDMGRLVITVGALAKGVEALSKATTALKSAKIAGNLSNVISAITESKAGNKAAESALVFMKKSAGTAAKALGIVGAIFAGIDLAVKEQLKPVKELEDATNKVTEAQSALADTQSEYDELIGKTEELTEAEKKRLEVLKETREEQEKQLTDAQHERWEKWNNIYGSGASVVVGGMDANTGGMAVGAVQTERMDISALRNYREELAEIAAQYQVGKASVEEYYSALEDLNAVREESVETIRAAILAGENVTDEQRALVDAYDRVQQILGATSDATAKYVSGLIEEARQSGKTEKELYDLVAAQITASNTKLNFSQQIMALQQLAAQAGYAGDALANTFALAGINESNVKRTAEGLLYTGQYSSYEEAYAEALRRAQSAMLYQFGNLTSTAPSGGWGGSTSGGSGGGGTGSSSASSKQNELDNAKKKAAQATIDAIKKQMDAETDAIDEQIDALKKQNEETERGEKLEELKLAILEKQDQLLNARDERTVRQYNAATGQWEGVADAQKVKDAEEALEDAKKDLRDYERDTERELAIEELEARKKAIEAAYQLKIDGWQKFIDELNGDVETEAALLAASLGDWDAYYEEMLKVYQKLLDAAQDYEDKKQDIQNSGDTSGNTGGNIGKNTGTAGRTVDGTEDSSGDAKPSGGKPLDIDNRKPTGMASNSLGNGGKDYTIGRLTGTRSNSSGGSGTNNSQNTGNSSTIKKPSPGGGINKVARYDSGGVLKGLGGIKATVDDEMVLPPDITAKMLRPSANAAFQARMRELGSLYDSTPVSQSVSGVVNNDRHDVTNNYYSVNGVTLSPQDANRPFSDVIEFLADAAHHMRPFSGM